MSRPKTSWPGLLPLFLWHIYYTTKLDAVIFPIHGSSSSTYVSCKFYGSKRFTGTWCIISIIAFTCVFPGGAVLVLIPYSFSINYFKTHDQVILLFVHTIFLLAMDTKPATKFLPSLWSSSLSFCCILSYQTTRLQVLSL